MISRPRRSTSLVRPLVAVGVLAAVALTLSVAALSGFTLAGAAASTATYTPATAGPFRSSETPRPEKARPDAAAIKRLVQGKAGLTVSVLGDSTGNDPSEWVRLWATSLAADGNTVTLHVWDDTAKGYSTPVTLGSGTRQIDLWNGSVPGLPAAGALPMLELLQPVRPGLVIYNFGHNTATVATGTALDQITTASETRWGRTLALIVTLQNPAGGKQGAISEAQRVTVEEWATSVRVPTIDVHAAFLTHADWAATLILDGAHPNMAGSKVWAAAVQTAVGP